MEWAGVLVDSLGVYSEWMRSGGSRFYAVNLDDSIRSLDADSYQFPRHSTPWKPWNEGRRCYEYHGYLNTNRTYSGMSTV